MLVKRPNVFLIYFILTQYTSLYLSLTFYFFLICINSMDRQINQFFKFPIYLRDRPGWTLRKISDINIDSVSFRMRMVTQNNTAPIRYIRYPVPAPSPIRTLVPTPFMFGMFPLVHNFHLSVSTISVSGAGPLSGSVNNSPSPSPCSPEGTCSCRAIFVYVAGLVTSKTLIASWRARPWSWSTHSPSPLTTPN